VSLRDENNAEIAVYHFGDVGWDQYTIPVADFTPPPPTRKFIHHLMYGKLCVYRQLINPYTSSFASSQKLPLIP